MIGAVVVLYNPTRNEIYNINTYKDKVDYTVIIDNSNNTNKEQVDNIVGISESVIYYSEYKNLGLAKGFNIGINLLIENGCEWALLLDADSRLSSDILTFYKRVIIENDEKFIAVLSPVHIFDRSNNKPYKGYRDVDWTMTSGCLFNCEIFKRQNGFMEELFVDGLDIDYCFKSHENGYRIIECGESVLNHNPAETKKILFFKYGSDSPFRYYMQARQLIWNWKRYGKLKMFGFYLYKWFKVIFLFPNKREYVSEMIKGTKDGKKLLKKYGV